MMKLATLCLSFILGAGMVLAGSPAKRVGVPRTFPQGKPIVTAPGEARTAPSSGHGIGFSKTGRGSALLSSSDVKKGPARVGLSGSTVYGALLVDRTDKTPLGITEVIADGRIKPVIPMKGPNDLDLQVNFFYIRQGHIYCLADEMFWGMSVGQYLLEYDLASGALVNTTAFEEGDIMFHNAAYDPEKDIIYGYYIVQEGEDDNAVSHVYFATASGAEPQKVTTIREIETLGLCAMTYNTVSKKLIGITHTLGYVCEINPENGDGTLIGFLPKESRSKYLTGLCYSPIDEAYFYVVCSDDNWAIQLLDENSFQVISSAPYDDLQGFGALQSLDTKGIVPDAPAEATLVGCNFVNGSLDGTITYRMPATTNGGTPVLGNVEWTLYIDDVEYKRGRSAAGSEVAIEVEGLTPGEHLFVLKVCLGPLSGRFSSTFFYVGNDRPCAPDSVTLDEEWVKWTPVTMGIHNGYVNPEEVTYNVYLNGKTIAEGVKSTEVPTHLPQGEDFTAYEATVEAVFDGRTSARTSSNPICYGDPIPLPAEFEPLESDARLFTIVNANGDNGTISFTVRDFGNQLNVPVFQYRYSGANDADDWLFLPYVELDDANASYEFSMNAFRTNKYTEEFSVQLCTAPDPSTVVKEIMPATRPDNVWVNNDDNVITATMAQRYTKAFSIPKAGGYYIGIHVTSPKDQFYLIMREFSVKKAAGVAPGNPDAVTGLTAVRGENGALNANLTFTLPTAAVNGTAYAADKTLTALIEVKDCEPVNVTGKPGETVTTTVPTLQGDNTITVTPKDGDLEGVSTTVTLYTGVERPGKVTDLKAEVDASNLTAHLTWKAPAEGIDGGYVAPTGITYYLCEYVTTAQGSGWRIAKEIGTDVYEYDYTIPENSSLALVDMGIVAENFVGRGRRVAYTSEVMGTPYDIPATSICTVQDALMPMVSYPAEYDWRLVSGNPAATYPAFTTDDNAQATFTMAENKIEGVKFTLPKFSTKGCSKPAVKLTVYGGSTSEFSLTAKTYGVEEKTQATYRKEDFSTPGRQVVTIELDSEFADKGWIELAIVSNVSYAETFIIYNYKVYDNVPYDFGVASIEGPEQPKIGEEAKFVAHVLNNGNTANTVPASNWKLVDSEGNVVADINVPAGTESIAPDAEATYDLSFTPNADQIGAYSLTFTIEKGDNKDNNDTLTKELSVEKGVKPVITDLKADEISSDHVTLGWTPLASAEDYFENFEEETPFVLERTSDMVAQFKRVDGDGKKLNMANAPNFNKIPGAGGPASFMLWNSPQVDKILGTEGAYPAKSGDQFLIAFCPLDGSAADDWLISPAILGGTDFSFSARALTYTYGAEKVEIMYSTKSNNPEDFQLLKTLDVNGQGTPVWQDFTYTLPADAKYFALHYVSADIFGLMIDDIAYVPASNGIKVVSFDVYRNGTLLEGSAPCADNTYTDATVKENTEYSYMVMPVLNDGNNGIASNVLTLRTTGIDGVAANGKSIATGNGTIIVNGYEGLAVAVVSADGKVVGNTVSAAATQRFAVLPGVYVVKAGDDIVKVIVK